MIELAHALTGGVIAYKIESPLISLPLALASHFIVDLFPHWNPHLGIEKRKLGYITLKTKILVFLDCFIGLILGVWLAWQTLPSISRFLFIISGCFWGVLPDLIESPYYFFGLRKEKSKIVKKVIAIQNKYHWKVKPLFGILIQIFYLSVLFYII